MYVTRGTTPTIIIELDCPVADLSEMYLTIHQGGALKMEKTLSDGVSESNTVSFTLTQSETLLFNAESNIQIQIRGKTEQGAFASEIYNTTIRRILKEGAI